MTPDARPIAAIDDDPTRTQPLRDDTRLLGRVLGDVLRAQTGDAGYRAHRGDPADGDPLPPRRRRTRPTRSARELAALLNELPIAQTLDVVRAFSYFSHLANIAEDVHQNRRRRAHALAGVAAAARQPRATRSTTLARARRRRATRSPRGSRDALRVSPVLTAHPTEVQRKSILDCRARDRARCSTLRDRAALTPDEAPEWRDASCCRQVLGAVADGDAAAVEAARSSTRSRTASRTTATRSSPRCRACTQTLAGDLAARVRRRRRACPPFLRMGSWIGGDRDGNPFVDGRRRSRYAIRAQAAVAFGHYLDEVHRLGAELSLSTRLVQADRRRCCALARARARREPAPAGRAVPAGADRHLRAARRDGRARSRGTSPPRAPHADAARRTTRRRRSSPTSRSIARVARHARRGARSPSDRLDAAAPRGARRSASISPRSTCARTPTCTRRSSPSSSRAPASRATTRRSTRRRACALLARRARARRACCASPHVDYAERTRSELAILDAAADVHRRFGAAALPHYVISKCQSVSDLLEVARAAEGSRACCAATRSRVDIVPLFETIDDLDALRRRSCATRSRCPSYRALARARAATGRR